MKTWICRKDLALKRLTIISGCSGGGKSTLLAELARRGYATVQEPGRRIVADELAGGGRALPWIDPEAFLERAVALSLDDMRHVPPHADRVFFDRGLFDALSALSDLTGADRLTGNKDLERFDRRVFLTPPWPEIYVRDRERQHGLDGAMEEYERLSRDYPAHGFAVTELEKVSVAERADAIIAALKD
jgi:predicted ATPase